MSAPQEAPQPEPAHTETPDTLLCTSCLEFKPPTDFRRRAKGQEQRVSQCRKCHNDAERNRLRVKRAKGQDRQMQLLATAIRQDRDTKRVQGLLASAIVGAGGYRSLLKKWYETIQEDVDTRKRPAQLVRLYSTIVQRLLRLECPPE